MDDESGYYISPKDLCLIGRLPEFISSGVRSFKIEGRMKSPEYVAAVTRCYRKYIDLAYNSDKYEVEKSDIDILNRIFNRGGFTEGFSSQKLSAKSLISFNKPKNCGIELGVVENFNQANGLIDIRVKNDLSLQDGIEINERNFAGGIVTYIKHINSTDAPMQKGASDKSCKEGELVRIGTFKCNILKGDTINKTSDYTLLHSYSDSFEENCNIKKIPTNFKLIIKDNAHIKLVCYYNNIRGDRTSFEYKSNILYNSELQTNCTKNISIQRIFEQFAKTGGTAFQINKFELLHLSESDEIINEYTCNYTDNFSDESTTVLFSLSVKEINYLRREEISILSNTLIETYKRRTNTLMAYHTNTNNYNENIYNTSSIDNNINVRHTYNNLNDTYAVNTVFNNETAIFLPIMIKSDEIKQYIDKHNDDKQDKTSIFASNIGQIQELKSEKNANLHADFTIYADHTINIYNSHTVNHLHKIGLNGGMLSVELNHDEQCIIAKNCPDDFSLEVLSEGNIPVMFTRHCPNNRNCTRGNKCEAKNIKDRKGETLESIPVGCGYKGMSGQYILSPKYYKLSEKNKEKLTQAGITIFRKYI